MTPFQSPPPLDVEFEQLSRLADQLHEEFRPRLSVALARAQAQGREDLQAQGLVKLGSWWHAHDDLKAAYHNYREGLNLARRSGTLRWQHRALNGLGLTLADLGRYHEADVCYRDALALARAQDDFASLACILNNTALMWSRLGQPEQALDDLLQSQELFLRVQHPVHTFLVARNLLWVLLDLGRYAQAYSVCKIYLALAEEHDLRGRQLELLGVQAICQAQLGRLGDAESSVADAGTLMRQWPDDHATPLGCIFLGMAYDALGHLAQATEVLERSVRLAELLEHRDHLARAHLLLSRLYHQQNDDRAAYRHSWAYFRLREQLLPPPYPTPFPLGDDPFMPWTTAHPTKETP